MLMNSLMPGYNIVEQGKPLKDAAKALILLHGRGGNAYDILTLADELCDDRFYIAVPQADGNAWYPFSFLSPREKNEPWLSASIKMVKDIIENISGILPQENIILMGFSQGACLALEVSAINASVYGGVVAFSGGLIGETLNPLNYSGNYGGTRIFIGNSDIDPYIPLSRTDESVTVLKKLGGDVTYRIYPGMGHMVTDEEISDVKKLLF